MNESHRSSWLLRPVRGGKIQGERRTPSIYIYILYYSRRWRTCKWRRRCTILFSQHQSHTDPAKYQHFFLLWAYISAILSLFFFFQSTSLKLDIIFVSYSKLVSDFRQATRGGGVDEFLNFSSKVSDILIIQNLFFLACLVSSLNLYNWMMWNFETIFDLASFENSIYIYHLGWAFYGFLRSDITRWNANYRKINRPNISYLAFNLCFVRRTTTYAKIKAQLPEGSSWPVDPLNLSKTYQVI